MSARGLPETDRRRAAVFPPLFGFHAWLMIAIAPRFAIGRLREDLVAEVIPLAVLLLGAACSRAAMRTDQGNGPARSIARWFAGAFLLIGFPIALVASASTRPELRSGVAFGTFGLAAGALVFALYVGAAAAVLSDDASLAGRIAVTPLGTARDPQKPPRRRGSGVLLTAVGGAMFVLVAVLPFLGTRASVERAWKDASQEGLVITTWVAILVAVSALALVVGPGLRAAKKRPPSKNTLIFRVIALLAVAAMGLFAWSAYAGVHVG